MVQGMILLLHPQVPVCLDPPESLGIIKGKRKALNQKLEKVPLGLLLSLGPALFQPSPLPRTERDTASHSLWLSCQANIKVTYPREADNTVALFSKPRIRPHCLTELLSRLHVNLRPSLEVQVSGLVTAGWCVIGVVMSPREECGDSLGGKSTIKGSLLTVTGWGWAEVPGVALMTGKNLSPRSSVAVCLFSAVEP